ncbi:hypothetical protein C1645_803903 [Glomus cerebriforme]|uniref:Uncharacterized protein n=1 Tax=Glomus cerebriforme TaxID=658196 RepID=A0A397T7B5_9GLOM|nr:hypothetical protein C1645_803903 [Glomus cerebriforme]
MNSTMTSAKSSSESSSYDESPFFARSRASSFSVNNSSLPTSSHSNSPIFFNQNFNNSRLVLSSHFDDEEELETPINIYHENRGRLEEDKKARTELDTDILNDDLYCPVQQQEINNNPTSRGLNIGRFASFFPRFSFSNNNNNNNNNNYNEVIESDTLGYYHNDMFDNNNNMFGTFDGLYGLNGVNSVACK